MDSKAVITWLAVVGRPTTAVAIGGVATTTTAGALLAPVPLTGVSASGTAGMLISKARVSWVGVTPRNIREVSVVGVSSSVVQGLLTSPVPIQGVSAKASAGHLVSKARVTWLNISAVPDKSVTLTQVSSQTLAGEITDPSAALAPRMRIIYENLADTAEVSASTAFSSYPPENLKSDVKSKPHRSTGPRVTYTAVWQSDQLVGGVGLPATNLTSDATIRVRLYGDTEGQQLIGDSGEVKACPGVDSAIPGWGLAYDYRGFSNYKQSRAAVWFRRQRTTVRRCTVEISDVTNPAGFIDCSRLVIGPYWEAQRNPKYGAEVSLTDTSKVDRLVSGDTGARQGHLFETLRLTLEDVPESSRAALNKVLRSGGGHRNLFISVFPEYAQTSSAAAFVPSGALQQVSPRYVADGYVTPGYVEGPDPGQQEVLPPLALASARSMEHDHMLYGRVSSKGAVKNSPDGWDVQVEVVGW